LEKIVILNFHKQLVAMALVASFSVNIAFAAGYADIAKNDSVELSREEVNTLISEFNYAMDGWDGADSAVKEDAEARLKDGLVSLLENGVSAEAIQAEVENKIINARKKQEYRNLVASLKAQNASEEKIAVASMEFMTSTSATGAAFAGGAAGVNYKRIGLIVGAIIVAAVITIVVIKCKGKKKHHDKPCPPKDDKPCPPKDDKPCPPKDDKPCPPKDDKPCPPKDDKPCPPKDDKPCPPKDDKPCPPKDEKPCPPKDEKPCPPKDEKPCPPKHEEKPCAPKHEEKPCAPKHEEKKPCAPKNQEHKDGHKKPCDK